MKSIAVATGMVACCGVGVAQTPSPVVTVANVNSGRCLDDPRFSSTQWIQLEQWSCNDGANQQFRVQTNADGSFTFIDAASKLCADIRLASNESGAPLQQYACNGTRAQTFKLEPARGVSGAYAIVNTGSGLCLDVPASSTAAGALLRQWTCNGTGAQAFRLDPVSGSLPAFGDNGATFTLSSPSNGALAKGVLDISGQAAGEWASVAAFDQSDGRKQVSSAVAPSGGTYQLPVDTTRLSNGTHTLAVIATAGQGSGATTEADIAVDVENNRTGVQAYATADEFVDSIGVNTDFSFGGPEWQSLSTPLVKLLLASGIRNFREAINVGNATAQTNLQAYLAARPLTKIDILTGIWNNGPYVGQVSQKNANAQVAAIAALSNAGVPITTIEGINEPDLNTQLVSTAQTVQWQKWLYAGVRSTSTLANTLVLGPSITGNTGAFTGIQPYLQGLNAHFYGNRQPETGGWGDNGYGSVDWLLHVYQAPLQSASGAFPVYVTEAGSSSAPTAGPNKALDYATEAVFMPRWFLYSFTHGVARMYKFAFDASVTDSATGATYGLLDKAGAPKPVYTAIKNLISLMSDPGSQPSPGKLDYTLSGDLSDVKSALFMKRDGSYILGLWIGQTREPETVVWNPETGQDLPPSTPQKVTITAQGVTREQTASPNSSGTWTSAAQLTGGSVTVPVTDKVVLVHLM